MSVRTDYFVLALALFLIALTVIACYYYVRARKASTDYWRVLLSQLIVMDRNNVAIIALDLIGEPGHSTGNCSLDGLQIAELIGGQEGLKALQANCDVLIDLACYVQRWYPEAMLVAEKLRLGARQIKWHLGRLQTAERTENLEINFADYAQRAIAIYYGMTRTLLALYETGNAPGLAELQKAI